MASISLRHDVGGTTLTKMRIDIVKQQYTKLKPAAKRLFGLSEKPDRSGASSRARLARAWPGDG
jgi:hypothetical protein